MPRWIASFHDSSRVLADLCQGMDDPLAQLAAADAFGARQDDELVVWNGVGVVVSMNQQVDPMAFEQLVLDQPVACPHAMPGAVTCDVDSAILRDPTVRLGDAGDFAQARAEVCARVQRLA